MQKLQGTYYIDAEMIRDAISRCSSFNVIHLDTTIKIDVFVLGQKLYDKTAFLRAQKGVMAPELDVSYLRLWAKKLQVLDLLDRVLEDAGLS